MNEQEWLACPDPTPMLEFLQGKASTRKLRLFACGCCRRIWQFLKDERSRAAVEASERYADKQMRRAELVVAQQQAMLGNKRFDEYCRPAENAAASVARPSLNPRWIAQLARWKVSNHSTLGIDTVEGRHASRAEAERNESLRQASILRCVFGPLPFRPVALFLAWGTSTVKQLATTIYEEKAFDRLPFLADALEDAGCSSPDILDHARQPGEHVRGCWVVDAVLDKK